MKEFPTGLFVTQKKDVYSFVKTFEEIFTLLVPTVYMQMKIKFE